MEILNQLRAKFAELLEARSAALSEMEGASKPAVDEKRSMTDDETAKFDAARAKISDLDEQREALQERIGELEEIERRTAEVAKIPAVHFTPRANPLDVLEDRSSTPTQLADALTRSIESRLGDDREAAAARRIFLRHAGQRDGGREWARQLLVRSTDDYASAWCKMMRGDIMSMTGEERAAISVGTNANGGYLVPTFLDPTIILTSDGGVDTIRPLSRQVTTIGNANTWKGVTSAGVTAGFTTELTEATDGSPTFDQPEISVYMAQAYVQASFEAFEDIAGLTSDVAMLFADAKDTLEASKHAVGDGSGEPTGIFTALGGNTNVQVVSTTAAAIGDVDLNAVYRSVGIRWRNRSTWVGNPLYTLGLNKLNSYTYDVGAGSPPRVVTRPLVESDDAPSTQTTTAKDSELILGDFANYVIVDKPGSFAVEFIQQVFGKTNGLPISARAWLAHWRTGADSVNDSAFRLLVDKTSA